MLDILSVILLPQGHRLDMISSPVHFQPLLAEHGVLVSIVANAGFMVCNFGTFILLANIQQLWQFNNNWIVLHEFPFFAENLLLPSESNLIMFCSLFNTIQVSTLLGENL